MIRNFVIFLFAYLFKGGLTRQFCNIMLQMACPAALTQLADAIIPAVYASYQADDLPELSAFYQSGVIVRNALLDEKANSGGTTIHIPFWKDIDPTSEPNYSTDNPADLAVPDKIVAGEMIARVANMNHAMSAADLVSELAGSDPMQRIRNRFGVYWMRQWQRRVIAIAQGLIAQDKASTNDMTIDLSVEDLALVSNANIFARSAFTAAVFTLGDHFGQINAIGVHSIIYKRMVDNDDIDFIKDSAGNMSIPTYLGKYVIVDDGMPVVAGTTSGYKFTSVLFGAGAIGYGEGTPKVPVEVFRLPYQGNGGGIEQLWERKTTLIHPFGYKFTSTTVAGQSPTLAELRTANNWSRQIERKNVPLAFLVTNG